MARTAKQRFKSAQTAAKNMAKRIVELEVKRDDYHATMQKVKEEIAKGLEARAQALREEAQMIGEAVPNLGEEVIGSPGDV